MSTLRILYEGAKWLRETLSLSTTIGVYRSGPAEKPVYTWSVERPLHLIDKGCYQNAAFSDSVRLRSTQDVLHNWTSPYNDLDSMAEYVTCFTSIFLEVENESWFDFASRLIDIPDVRSVGWEEGTWYAIFVSGNTVRFGTSDVVNVEQMKENDFETSTDFSKVYYPADLLRTWKGTQTLVPPVKGQKIESPKDEIPREYTHGPPPIPPKVLQVAHKAIASRSLEGYPDSIFLPSQLVRKP